VAKPRSPTRRRGGTGSPLRAVKDSTVQSTCSNDRLADDGQPAAVEVEEPSPRTLLLRVRGELDEAASSELTRILDNRLGAPEVSRVLVDLIGVVTLTSAGVCVLHRLHRDCRVRGLHLVLVGTTNPAVHRLLYLSGLLPLVDARPTVQAALHAHTSPHRPAR
jgi:anti-anti-sigma factor